MSNENSEPENLPDWAKPITTNFIGIDLLKLNEEQIRKLVKLMEEVNFTPEKMEQHCNVKS